MSKATAQKPKNEKFRVKPNLSLRGRDLMTRLQNRTIEPNRDGFYDLREEIDASRKMSKADIARKHLEVSKEINSLTEKLNKR